MDICCASGGEQGVVEEDMQVALFRMLFAKLHLIPGIIPGQLWKTAHSEMPSDPNTEGLFQLENLPGSGLILAIFIVCFTLWAEMPCPSEHQKALYS